MSKQALDYMQLAIRLFQCGDKNGALAVMDAWINEESDNSFAYCKRGLLFKTLRRFNEAIDSLNKAVLIDPKNYEAFYERGDILQYHELFEQAMLDFNSVISLQPNLSIGYEGLAEVQYALGYLDEALVTVNHALGLSPENSAAENLRYNLLLDLRKHETLLQESERSIKNNPKSPDAHTRYGKLLLHLRQLEGSQAAFERALELDGCFPAARQGLANLFYQQGRWEEAYGINFTANFVSNTEFLKSFGKPIYTGEQQIAGKTVLIHAELGQGDTIQLCRFVSLVSQCGANVILRVPKSLKRLLGTVEGVTQVLAFEEVTLPFDFICSTLALPSIFRVRPSNVAFSSKPYLKIKSEWLEESPQLQLAAREKLRVGIVWAGGHSHYNYRRSVPLNKFLPLLQMRNIEFLSLQKGRPRNELSAISDSLLIDISTPIDDFADTASLLIQMDLLITVDTASAHVAGALGLPVWVLSRHDHPWLIGRHNNPWYSSMRMYTQNELGNWDEVIERIKSDLHALLHK